MRAPRFIFAITLALPVLAACQLALPGGQGASAPVVNSVTMGDVTVTSLDAPATGGRPAATVQSAEPPASKPPSAALSTTPAAAAPTPPQATDKSPEVPAMPVSPQALECMSTGGTWGQVPDTVAYSCFRQTRDAGKSCRRQTDCETECLARSRTCAPISPMFGCNPVLQADGREVTLCID